MTMTDDGTLIIPDSGDELEEMLHDPKVMAQLDPVKNPDGFAEFTTAYARSRMEKDKGLQQQIEEGAEKVYADMHRDAGENIERVDIAPTVATLTDPAAVRANTKMGLFNPKAMGAKLDGTFDDISDYFRAIWFGNAENPDRIMSVRSITWIPFGGVNENRSSGKSGSISTFDIVVVMIG